MVINTNALSPFDINRLTPYAVGFDRVFDRDWETIKARMLRVIN